MRVRVNDRWKLKTLALCVVAACAAMFGQSPPPNPALATLGGGFTSNTAQANGTTLHYVRSEDWHEFHQVMPRLAQQFAVIAVDLRGLGSSAVSHGGYDLETTRIYKP